MNFAKWFEDCRETSLETTADAVECLYRAKSGCSDGEAGRAQGRGDFLYDMINLNVGYLTQMARLGSAYSVFAHRFLASMYGAYAAPGCSEPNRAAAGATSSCELSFEGAPGDVQTRYFLLSNRGAGDETPEFGPIELEWGKDKVQPTKPKFLRGDDPAHSKPIHVGDTARIALKLTVPPSPSGRCWRGSLKVRLGQKQAEYVVSIRVL